MSSFSNVSVVDLSSVDYLNNVYPGQEQQHNLSSRSGLQTFLNGGNSVTFYNNVHTLQDVLDAANGAGTYNTNNFKFTAVRYPADYETYSKEGMFVWTSHGYRRLLLEDDPEPACDGAFKPGDKDTCPFLRFNLYCTLGQVQDALGLNSLQFLTYAQPKQVNPSAPMSINTLANLFTAFFNGPMSGSIEGYGTNIGPSCPCGFPCPSNSDQACFAGQWDFLCELAPWKLLVDSIQVDVNGVQGKTSYIGPCWNPGAGMSVAGGAGPFFQASASVSRILNLDKIQFSTFPSVRAIKCKNTGKGKLFVTLYGYTCASDDTIYGENAEFTIKAAATVNAFGDNFGFPCNASAEDGMVKGQACPYDATRLQDQCIGAKLPGAKVSVTLSVPFIPNIPEQGCELFGERGEVGFFDFTQMDVEVDYALDDAPTLLFPQNNVVPPSFQDNMQTIMMEVANTDMRQFIKNYLNGKVADLVKSNEFLQLFECVINHYQREWKVCTVFESSDPINCSGTVPVYPGSADSNCSPCDECCLCLQNGDCGPKCRQDCPCIREWCTSSGRNESAFTILIAVSVGVAALVGIIILYYFVRGLKRPILPLWFPLVEY